MRLMTQLCHYVVVLFQALFGLHLKEFSKQGLLNCKSFTTRLLFGIHALSDASFSSRCSPEYSWDDVDDDDDGDELSPIPP